MMSLPVYIVYSSKEEQVSVSSKFISAHQHHQKEVEYRCIFLTNLKVKIFYNPFNTLTHVISC